jgi:hypothetical protein
MTWKESNEFMKKVDKIKKQKNPLAYLRWKEENYFWTFTTSLQWNQKQKCVMTQNVTHDPK